MKAVLARQSPRAKGLRYARIAVKVSGEKNAHAKLSKQDVYCIHRLRARGFSCISIASIYPVEPGIISKITKGLRWGHLEGEIQDESAVDRLAEAINSKRRRTTTIQFGVLHPLAKLDNEKVRAIRNARAAGSTCVVLGRQYHVSSAKISQICRGKSWAQVE